MARIWWSAAGCLVVASVLGGAAPSSSPATADSGAEKAKARTQLLDLMGDGEATREQVGDVMTLLMEKRQLVVVALAGKKARLHYLQTAVTDIETEAEGMIRSDEAVAAIRKSLATMQEQLVAAERSGGSQLDIAYRQENIARQAALLADRREAIRGRAHGGTLQELMRNEVDAEADVKELEATLASVEMQITKGQKSQPAR